MTQALPGSAGIADRNHIEASFDVSNGCDSKIGTLATKKELEPEMRPSHVEPNHSSPGRACNTTAAVKSSSETHWLSGWPKKSPNFIFTTKMVFPKSLKFMSSGSQESSEAFSQSSRKAVSFRKSWFGARRFGGCEVGNPIYPPDPGVQTRKPPIQTTNSEDDSGWRTNTTHCNRTFPKTHLHPKLLGHNCQHPKAPCDMPSTSGCKSPEAQAQPLERSSNKLYSHSPLKACSKIRATACWRCRSAKLMGVLPNMSTLSLSAPASSKTHTRLSIGHSWPPNARESD